MRRARAAVARRRVTSPLRCPLRVHMRRAVRTGDRRVVMAPRTCRSLWVRGRPTGPVPRDCGRVIPGARGADLDFWSASPSPSRAQRACAGGVGWPCRRRGGAGAELRCAPPASARGPGARREAARTGAGSRVRGQDRANTGEGAPPPLPWSAVGPRAADAAGHRADSDGRASVTCAGADDPISQYGVGRIAECPACRGWGDTSLTDDPIRNRHQDL
jgi:hypothetical protein